ncbi:SCO6880 family protein [Miltoncostaea oceani]|uniref:SCO6880 family protein n=1 Tax=Miltoncostaea oceani TaxID=2843216 RepID=UPI001C3DE4F9|nr:SCO6880 family protein [Miltoncostaea oceani]
MAPEPSRYRFGPLEPGGAVGGLGWSQVACVGLGLVGLVTCLNLAPGTSGALSGLAVAGAGLGGAFLHLGGRPPVAWAAIATGFASRRARGRHHYLTKAPLRGYGFGEIEGLDLPDNLSGLRIVGARSGRGDVGIAHDGSTWTAVLAVQGGAFALLELADKERRLARWGAVLSGFARPGSPVSRLAWIDRTVTQGADELGRYLAEGLTLPPTHSGVASYLELLDEAAPAARQHETFLALQIDARRAAGVIRRAGGGEAGAAAVLLRELTALSEHLVRAEVVVAGALSPRLLARAIRLGFSPGDRSRLDRLGAGDRERAGTDPANAGPMAAAESWRTYQSDDALHCSYWIAEWPRVEVGADFLLPFLLGGTTRRSVAVVMEPLDPARALRAAENARTNEISDDELRARMGFLATARRRRQQQALVEREQELAEGHSGVRFSGYVTVSADGADELSAAMAELEQSAQMARLELRPLYGEQAVGFTYTLPLCRGLR